MLIFGDTFGSTMVVRGALHNNRNIFKCLENGYLVFFKNGIWSGNIFFPFRIVDRKIVEDKVFK